MPKTRILYVDDDEIYHKIVSNYFVDEPEIELCQCRSATDVLEKLNQGERFDILLLDWNMPEMSGYDLVRALRANPQFNTLPIMMVTSNNQLDEVQNALTAGAGEYLMKPFSKEMLINKISLALLN